MASLAIRGSLVALAVRARDTQHGTFAFAEFRNVATHRSAFALVRGDVTSDEPLLCRVHSSCVTSEFLGACDCDCAGQLDEALAEIAREGRGALFYLAQEGRGAGLVAKARDRMIVQSSRHAITTFEAYEAMGLRPDMRRYDEVADMCALLSISAPLVLLSNNPGKVSALEREKLQIAEMRPLVREASPFNAHYLDAKRESGHVLGLGRADVAELPRAVARIAPEPVEGLADVVRVASYLLPIDASRSAIASERASAPTWVVLEAFIDLTSRSERIALSSAIGTGVELRLRHQPEPIVERFPLARTPARAAWERFARIPESAGAWLAVLSPRDANAASGASAGRAREIALLAALARARASRFVADDCAGEPDLASALRTVGLGAVRSARPSRNVAASHGA